MVSSNLTICNGSSFWDEISQSADLSSFTLDLIVYRSESNNGGESIIGMQEKMSMFGEGMLGCLVVGC
jgi:hypothetical protein